MSEGASTSDARGGRDSTPRASYGAASESPSSPFTVRPSRDRSESSRPKRRSVTQSDQSVSFGRRASIAPPKNRFSSYRDDHEELDNFEQKNDELKHKDRGEALIRHRMRQRKREKLMKLQREGGDFSQSFTSDSLDPSGSMSYSQRPGSAFPDSLRSPNTLRPENAGGSAPYEDESVESYGSRDEDDGEDEEEDEDEEDDNEHPFDDDDQEDNNEDLEYTLKDRQDAFNFEHPFGLPIWKPALYKKSRSITRSADQALKCMPGQNQARGALPGNVFWLVFFGIWIGAICFVLSGVLRLVPRGGAMYSRVLYGLATYIMWPFGNYVELECTHQSGERHGPCRWTHIHEHDVKDDDSDKTLNATNDASESTLLLPGVSSKPSYNAVSCDEDDADEADSPQTEQERIGAERGVYHYVYDDQGRDIGVSKRWGGIIVYALLYGLVLVPLLGTVCLICWFLVVPIPMARLSWVLLQNLAVQPLALHFRSPLQIDTTVMRVKGIESDEGGQESMAYPLRPGQAAPRLKPKHRKKGTSKRRSVILLCNYRAVGKEYWKYTVGGVNILFVNTLPIVFFTILAFFVLRPLLEHFGVTHGILPMLCGDGAVFIMSLCSVLPLSYFIGMAVATISTQSSIGMGAVINATFGSIIELLLYSIALMQGRSGLVEGSLIGSILAGVLLMPGLSMCSGATRRKEQKFNAQSAGVTSTMLIMAIIGILTPTIFYQIYGTFELKCSGCPDDTNGPQESWKCQQCSYEHLSPMKDPFYQSKVRGLIYTCAVVLIFAYAVGLWFSLRTHASQIWNSAQTTPSAANAMPEHMPPGMHRASVYKRMLPANYLQQLLPTHTRHDSTNEPHMRPFVHDAARADSEQQPNHPAPAPDGHQGRDTAGDKRQGELHTPSAQGHAGPSHTVQIQEPAEHDSSREQPSKKQSAEDLFLDAAAKMYQYIFNQQKGASGAPQAGHDSHDESHESSGHDAPSWSRRFALSVLLGCTVLYAIIAEILVDVVDVVVKGSGLPEKFIGVTIFALVPNTTEFMNAMSFAINGNIALSLEIGSAYVLQVCLIQIPVLVGFSAWYNATHSFDAGQNIEDYSFTLLFPRWDIIAILLSIFLLTYTYIEARSNYHRGSILVFAYIVFIAGFYFAPSHDPDAFLPETLGKSMNWLMS